MKKIFIILIYCFCFANSLQSQVAPIFLDKGKITIDTLSFEKIPNDVRIVGLGEFTHGGHETIGYRAELCKYLIRRKGVRNILFELPDIRLRPINLYLCDDNQIFDKKKLTNLLGKQLKNTLFFTEEYIDFFSWVKEHNLKVEEKVTVKGIDIFDLISPTYLIYTYLNKIAPDFVNTHIRQWTATNDSLVINDISHWFDGEKDVIKTEMKADDFQQISMDMRNAKAFFKYNFLRFKGNQQEFDTFRDSIMAINTLELLSNKSVLWAHNGHILPQMSIATKENNVVIPYRKLLGSYLKETFGNQYFVIVTDYTKKATVTTIEGNTFKEKHFCCQKKTSSFLLQKKYDLKEGIIPYKFLKDRNISVRLNNLGVSGEETISVANNLDILILFEEVKPSIILQ